MFNIGCIGLPYCIKNSQKSGAYYIGWEPNVQVNFAGSWCWMPEKPGCWSLPARYLLFWQPTTTKAVGL
jgi:hypothetical protein